MHNASQYRNEACSIFFYKIEEIFVKLNELDELNKVNYILDYSVSNLGFIPGQVCQVLRTLFC